jgi:hypothetical protein
MRVGEQNLLVWNLVRITKNKDTQRQVEGTFGIMSFSEENEDSHLHICRHKNLKSHLM